MNKNYFPPFWWVRAVVWLVFALWALTLTLLTSAQGANTGYRCRFVRDEKWAGKKADTGWTVSCTVWRATAEGEESIWEGPVALAQPATFAEAVKGFERWKKQRLPEILKGGEKAQ
jgi:hypothetical protein